MSERGDLVRRQRQAKVALNTLEAALVVCAALDSDGLGRICGLDEHAWGHGTLPHVGQRGVDIL